MADRARRARELRDDIRPSARRLREARRQAHDHLARRDVRILQQIRRAVDQPDGHLVRLQRRDQVGVPIGRVQRAISSSSSCWRAARASCDRERGREIRSIHRRGEPREHRVGVRRRSRRRGRRRSGTRSTGATSGRMPAAAGADHTAELVVGDRRLHEREDRFVDRDVDLLAAPAPVPFLQARRASRSTANSPASRVTDRDAGARRRAVGSPVVWRMPPIASPIEPKPGSDARGPVCPKPETCTSTMPGFAAASVVVRHPPARERARAGSSRARRRSRAAMRRAASCPRGSRRSIATERLLRAIAGHHRLRPSTAHAVAPHDVADVGRLDLDDVGAEVTEHLARERPGDERAELEDAHARERRAAGGLGVLVTGSTVGSAASGGRYAPDRGDHDGLRTERALRCAQGRARRVRREHRAAGRADLHARSAKSPATRTSRRR